MRPSPFSLFPLHSPHDVSALIGPVLPPGSPQTRMIGIMALNGAANIAGSSASLGSPADARLLAELRAWSDAVIVSAATVQADGYGPMSLPDDLRRQRRHAGRALLPQLVILSPSLSLEPEASVLSDPDAQPLVLTMSSPFSGHAHARRRRILEEAGAQVRDIPSLSPRSVLAALRTEGHARISIEGGPSLYSRFLAEDLVDVVHLSIDPRMPTRCDLPLVQASADAAQPVWRNFAPEAAAVDEEGVVFLRYRRAHEDLSIRPLL